MTRMERAMTMRGWAIGLAMLPAVATAQDLPATRAGLDEAVAARFAEADRNHDGLIDRAEAAQALGVVLPAARPRSQALFDMDTGPDGRPRLSLRQDGPLGSGGMFDMLFGQIDRNRDGRITLAELQGAARARFDMADADHDGTLSRAEIAAARNQLGLLQQALGAAR